MPLYRGMATVERSGIRVSSHAVATWRYEDRLPPKSLRLKAFSGVDSYLTNILGEKALTNIMW